MVYNVSFGIIIFINAYISIVLSEPYIKSETKKVNKFDVTPPGAAAIIITPIANSGAIGHIFIRRKAIIGSRIICEKEPTKKSRGCFITLEKSAPVKPKPKTNIIKARAKGKITSVTKFIYDIIRIL